MQPTFKEYLETSRRELEEALQRTPVCINRYTIKRYCRLMVGESLESKQTMQLKPKHSVEVKWLYEDLDSPTPVHVIFGNVNGVDSNQAFDVYWTSNQLRVWLEKNAKLN